MNLEEINALILQSNSALMDTGLRKLKVDRTPIIIVRIVRFH